MSKSMNKNLHQAKQAKKDEFYTRLQDIEKELQHYKHHFKDKVVYCNCDDARHSSFFKYFSLNFEHLGLKKLITTCYEGGQGGKALYLEYSGDLNGNKIPDPEEIGVHDLQGDGDFRSPECVELLKQADIVVTNPPFSLFREYVAQLITYGKKFLIVGNQNAITYKEIFPLLKANEMWLGCNMVKIFDTPDEGDKTFGNICWFTNLDHNKRNEELILFRKYDPDQYPKYDNYDAIEVSKTVDIPMDYEGIMGVPITFMFKHNPDQFEIVGCSYSYGRPAEWSPHTDMSGSIDGINIYKRLFIRNKKVQK
jgi:hypothetical protein